MERARLKTILYVDDEPDIREVVQLALTFSNKLTVHTCESGADALFAIPRLKPDLVLLDGMMPGMDGPTTLQRIRADAALCDTPVVFITAKAHSSDVERYARLGAVGVIAKPFDPMQLEGQVFDIWEKVPHV